jgi:hypothetical protein
MIIYVHDPRSPFPKDQTFAAHKAAADVFHVHIAETDTMQDVARAVIARAGCVNNIWLLLFLAHGNRAWLQFGRGLTEVTASQFGTLKPYMSPLNRGIEIHGCAVASDSDIADPEPPCVNQSCPTRLPLPIRAIGLRGTERSSPKGGINTLMALAKAVGCTVKGAINAQAVDASGEYNGPYVEVFPDGFVRPRQGRSTWVEK